MSHIETPRLVKKPGEWKRVENPQELAEALAEGWCLRLEDYVPPVVAEEPLVEAPEDPEPVDAGDEDGTASEPDAAHEDAPPAKRKPGRPKKTDRAL